MTTGIRYAGLGLIAGLTCLGSAALAKQAVLPKDSQLPVASAKGNDNNDHGKIVSEAAKSGTKGIELADLASSKRHDDDDHGNGHGHGHDDDHGHGHDGNHGHGDDHGHDGDHGHGHPRSPH